MLSRDGRKPLPLVLINDQEFVALDDLASTFALTVQDSLGAVTVSYKGKTVVLTADQTLASVAGRLISLPAPPVHQGRRWLVPVDFLSRALALIYDTRLELRKPSRLLIVGDLRVPRVVARYDAVGPNGRLTIDATPRTNSTVSQDNEHLTIKFDADALDVAGPLLLPQAPPSLVTAIRVVEPVSIVVDLVPKFGGFKAIAQPLENTMRLVIDLSAPQQTEPAPPSVPPVAPQPSPELPPALGAPATPLRTIIVDPGHGGDDEGAKGANGAKEKDLALAVSRRVRAALEARLGVRVLLTRDDDRNVPVDERTALANNNKADLFISIHANAAARKSVSGASIFVAAFDKDAAQSAGIGAPERVPAFGGGLRDIEMVPWDLAQIRHLDKSSAFASLVEQQFHDHVPLSGHPTEQAPLRVLESANMPAVLIELGYLSNPEQEKLLTGDGFQNAFVQAIADAIVRFRESLQAGGTR
jgi:N-acetylmuramoyl-L-alanine amidase